MIGSSTAAERGVQGARYPRRSEITRAITAARANGIIVNTVEIDRKGRIRVSYANSRAATLQPDEFERWDKDGRL